MNYLQPARLNHLARAYAVGTLTGGARRRFESVMRASPEARAAMQAWQARLAVLESATPPIQPPLSNWAGIERRLFGTPERPRGWLERWLPGRALAGLAAGALVAVLTIRTAPELAGLQPTSQELPQSYVGLLHNAQGQPVLLASSLRHGRQLTLKVLAPIHVPEGMVARLWAIPDAGTPFPMATLPPRGSLDVLMPDTSEKLLSHVPRLGVTLEPANAPAASPGAYVLTGHCVKLW